MSVVLQDNLGLIVTKPICHYRFISMVGFPVIVDIIGCCSLVADIDKIDIYRSLVV